MISGVIEIVRTGITGLSRGEDNSKYILMRVTGQTLTIKPKNGGMKMAKIYYQEDCNLSPDGKPSLLSVMEARHAHALNLKESGCNVIIGLYEGSRSWKRQKNRDLKWYTSAEAAKADIISDSDQR